MPGLASTIRGLRDRLRSAYVRWLTLALGATALANLALTFFLPGPAIPLRFHGEGSLTYLVHNEQISVDRRFGLYLELDEATDGGTLVVPVQPAVLDPELVEGFAGLVTTVCEFEPPPLPPGTTDGAVTGLFETEDREDLRYWIVPGQSGRWWLSATGEGLVLIPDSEVALPGACR